MKEIQKRWSVVYWCDGGGIRCEIVNGEDQLHALKNFYDQISVNCDDDDIIELTTRVLSVTDVTEISNSDSIMTKKEVNEAIAKKSKEA